MLQKKVLEIIQKKMPSLRIGTAYTYKRTNKKPSMLFAILIRGFNNICLKWRQHLVTEKYCYLI